MVPECSYRVVMFFVVLAALFEGFIQGDQKVSDDYNTESYK
jgi:hypothetical protein